MKITFNYDGKLYTPENFATLFDNDEFDYHDCKEYVCDTSSVKKTLGTYGVAIIPTLLTEKECNKMYSGAWDYMENVSYYWDKPLKRDDVTTYREFSNLGALHSMLIQHYGIGHSQFCWDIRQNPKVVDVFASIWNTSDLLTSFDGASIHLPPEITNKGWLQERKDRPTGGWLHTDQSFLRNDFECIQSWVTAFDVNDGDATLLFLEGSHLKHKDCAKKYNITEKDDWYKLSEEHIQFYLDEGCKMKRIKCPKGSMVLWDSRTIHCGSEAVKK